MCTEYPTYIHTFGSQVDLTWYNTYTLIYVCPQVHMKLSELGVTEYPYVKLHLDSKVRHTQIVHCPDALVQIALSQETCNVLITSTNMHHVYTYLVALIHVKVYTLFCYICR
jgi:hypothetical protein